MENYKQITVQKPLSMADNLRQLYVIMATHTFANLIKNSNLIWSII